MEISQTSLERTVADFMETEKLQAPFEKIEANLKDVQVFLRESAKEFKQKGETMLGQLVEEANQYIEVLLHEIKRREQQRSLALKDRGNWDIEPTTDSRILKKEIQNLIASLRELSKTLK